jgi:hypothetical protein
MSSVIGTTRSTKPPLGVDNVDRSPTKHLEIDEVPQTPRPPSLNASRSPAPGTHSAQSRHKPGT